MPVFRDIFQPIRRAYLSIQLYMSHVFCLSQSEVSCLVWRQSRLSTSRSKVAHMLLFKPDGHHLVCTCSIYTTHICTQNANYISTLISTQIVNTSHMKSTHVKSKSLYIVNIISKNNNTTLTMLYFQKVLNELNKVHTSCLWSICYLLEYFSTAW